MVYGLKTIKNLNEQSEEAYERARKNLVGRLIASLTEKNQIAQESDKVVLRFDDLDDLEKTIRSALR